MWGWGTGTGTTKSPWQLIKTLTTAQPAKRFSGNRKPRSGAKKSPSKMEARPKSPTSAHLGQIGGAGRLSAPTCRFPAIKARHLNFGLVPQLHLPLRNHNCHSGVIDYLSGLSARPHRHSAEVRLSLSIRNYDRRHIRRAHKVIVPQKKIREVFSIINNS